jgi:hypothetical protein
VIDSNEQRMTCRPRLSRHCRSGRKRAKAHRIEALAEGDSIIRTLKHQETTWWVGRRSK